MRSPRWHFAILLLAVAGVTRASEPLPGAAPDVSGMTRAAESLPGAALAGHSHALENPLVVMVMAEELEWQDGSPDGTLAWDGFAWIGRDNGRLLLRSEGARTGNATDDTRIELGGWRPLGAWWDVIAGVRHDLGAGPSRTYGLLGFQGLLPYRVELEADFFAGEGGQAGTRVEAEYRLLVTNRLILVPRLEGQAFTRDDAANGIGSGLAKLEGGFRLRYEIRREFAPYLGMEWTSALGETADLARLAGEPVRDRRLVAGLRLWF